MDDIAGNTGAIADSMDITEEDLKYLRDIAEQEAVNRFTTAEISVDMSGMQNNISNGMDLDGVISGLTEGVNEAIDSMAEGVHDMMKSGYDFYLKKCLLPVTPQKLEIKINNANDTVTLINEGEINILKTAALTDIEFECEIPQVKQPYAVYKSGFQGASYFLDYFEGLKTSKQPFQFLVSRTMPNGKVLVFHEHQSFNGRLQNHRGFKEWL